MNMTKGKWLLGVLLALTLVGADVFAASLIDLSDPQASSLSSIFLGAAGGDWLGDSLYLSDLNKDGELDVVMGAYKHSGPNGARSGRVYVIYGPVATATMTVDLNSQKDLNDLANSYLIIDGDDAGDLFGYSVTSGDINHDGRNDLIVGAPLGDWGGSARCGNVYVFLGLEVGGIVVAATEPYRGPYKAKDAADWILYGAGEDDVAGMELLCADFSLDGATDDLIISAPFGTPEGEFEGRAYVFACPEDATAPKTFSLANNYSFLFKNLPYNNSSNLNNTGLAFGNLTATGGVPDPTPCLVFGLKGAKVSGGAQTGVVYGVSARPFSATMPISEHWIDYLTEVPKFKIYGPSAGAEAGEVVRVADVNQDATPDLIIGCPSVDPSYAMNAETSSYALPEFWGATYVLYGPIPTGAEFQLNQLGPGGPVPNLRYTIFKGVGGYDVGTAVVPVPSGTDTVVAISNSITSSTPDNYVYAGRTYVFYSSSIAGATEWDVSKRAADVTISGAAAYDEFSRALTFGKIFTNDTFAIVAGSSFMDPTVAGEAKPRYDAGQVYILPVSILSPVPGDMNTDRRVDYRDVFTHSPFWRGSANWKMLQGWHDKE